MDIAQLGFNVNSSGLLDGIKNIDKLDVAGKRFEKTSESTGKTTKASGDLIAQSMGRAGVGMDGAAKSSAGLLSVVTKLGPLIGGLSFAAAIVSIERFQTQIAEVSTLVDEATFDMDSLTDATLDQARQFGNMPTAQAAAHYQAISAGADTAEKSIAAVDAANKLSIGGVTSVTVAIDGLTSASNAWGDSAGTFTDISDAMFVAVREGKTTIEQLSASIGNVAPMAAQAGVSLDEVLAATAALTKGGASTSVSMNGLRAIMAAIIKPTQEARDLAQSLGIEFNSQALQANGLSGFLEDLKVKTGGSSDAMAVLFGGVEALTPALALTGKASGDFADVLAEMEDKLGATEFAFLKMSLTLGFQTNRIVAATHARFLELTTTLGNALVPALKFVADNMWILEHAITAVAVAITARAIVASQQYIASKLQMIAADRAAAVAATASAVEAARAAEIVSASEKKAAAAMAATAAATAIKQKAILASAQADIVAAREALKHTTSLKAHEAAEKSLAAAIRNTQTAKLASVNATKAAHAAHASSAAATLALNSATANTAAVAGKAAAATAAVSVAAKAGAIAMRGLAGAMALIGGPIGLILLAATAIYTYRDSIKDALFGTSEAVKAQRTHEVVLDSIADKAIEYAAATEQVQKQLRGETEAALLAARSQLEVADARFKAAQANIDSLEESNLSARRLGIVQRQAREELSAATVELGLQKEEVDALEEVLSQMTVTQTEANTVAAQYADTNKELNDQLAVLEHELEHGAQAARIYALELSGLTTQQAGQQAFAEQYADQLKEEIQLRDDARNQLAELVDENELLTVALEHGAEAARFATLQHEGFTISQAASVIELEAANEAIEAQIALTSKIGQEMDDLAKSQKLQTIELTQGADAAEKAKLMIEGYSDAQAENAVETANAMEAQREFHGVLVDSISNADSIKDVFSNLGSWLKDWLKEKIAHFAANKLTLAFDTVGQDGVSGAIGKVLSSVKGLFSGAGAAASASTGSLAAATASTTAMQGATAGLGAQMTAALPQIALVTGGFLALRSALSSTTTVTEGFQVGVSGGQVVGNDVENTTRDGGIFSSSWSRDVLSQLNADVQREVETFFTDMSASIIESASVLGVDGASAMFDNYDIAVQQFMGEDSSEQLARWMEEQQNSAYTMAFNELSPQLRSLVNDGVAEPILKPIEQTALTYKQWLTEYDRLGQNMSDNMSDYNGYLRGFNSDVAESAAEYAEVSEGISASMQDLTIVARDLVPQFEAMGANIGDSTDDMIESIYLLGVEMGGVAELTERMAFFTANFVPEAERYNTVVGQAQLSLDSFNEGLGLADGALINTRDGLYEHINSLDLQTDAGREAAATALAHMEAIIAVEDAQIEQTERLQAVSDATRILSTDFLAAAPSAQAFADKVVELVGGLDSLQAKTNTVYGLLFSDEEQRQIALAQSAVALQEFNSQLGLVGDSTIDSAAGLQTFIDTQIANGGMTAEQTAILLNMSSALETVNASGQSTNEILNELPPELAAVAGAFTQTTEDMNAAAMAQSATALLAAGDVQGASDSIDAALAGVSNELDFTSGEADRLNESLGLAGDAAITTTDQLRNYSDALDLNTEAGGSALAAIENFVVGIDNATLNTVDATTGIAGYEEQVQSLSTTMVDASAVAETATATFGAGLENVNAGLTSASEVINVASGEISTGLVSIADATQASAVMIDGSAVAISGSVDTLAQGIAVNAEGVNASATAMNDSMLSVSTSIAEASGAVTVANEGMAASLAALAQSVSAANESISAAYDSASQVTQLSSERIASSSMLIDQSLSSISASAEGSAVLIDASTAAITGSIDQMSAGIVANAESISGASVQISDQLTVLSSTITVAAEGVGASTTAMNESMAGMAAEVAATSGAMGESVTGLAGAVTEATAAKVAAHASQAASYEALDTTMNASTALMTDNTATLGNVFAALGDSMLATAANIEAATGHANSALDGFGGAINGTASAAASAAGVAASAAGSAAASAGAAAHSAGTAGSAAVQAANAASNAAGAASRAASAASKVAETAKSTGSFSTGLYRVAEAERVVTVHQGEMIANPEISAQLRALGVTHNSIPDSLVSAPDGAAPAPVAPRISGSQNQVDNRAELLEIRRELERSREQSARAADAMIRALDESNELNRQQSAELKSAQRENERLVRKIGKAA